MALSLTTAFLLIVILGARILQGSWTAPGAFFGLIWMIASVPAVIVLPSYVSPATMLLIASFIVAMVLGSQITLQRRPMPEPLPAPVGVRPRPVPKLRGLSVAVLIFALGGFSASVGYVWDAGYSLMDLADGETWLDLAIHYSAARYHGDYVEPLAVRFLLASNFVGALVGGMLVALARTTLVRIIGALPVFAGALITVITTAKSPMLLAGVFVLSGWLAHRASIGTSLERPPTARRWLLVGAGVAAMGVIGTASLALRYGTDTTDAALLTERIAGYVFGHMIALSAWLSTENWSLFTPTWGAFTFAGLFEFLGLSRRAAGLYDPIGLNDWSAESNVFSALRGVIGDFSLIGGWALTVLVGAGAGRAYSRLRAGTGTVLSRLGLAIYYAVACWSPIVSILSYNVMLLAIVVAAITLLLASRLFEADRESRRPGNQLSSESF